MLLLILFPIFQFVYGLDDSTLVLKISDNNYPCKSCKLLVQSFEKVIIYKIIVCTKSTQQ